MVGMHYTKKRGGGSKPLPCFKNVYEIILQHYCTSFYSVERNLLGIISEKAETGVHTNDARAVVNLTIVGFKMHDA